MPLRSTTASEAERVLLQVLEDLSLPVLVIDPELTLLHTNQAGREMLEGTRGLRMVAGLLRADRPDQHERLVRAVSQTIAYPAVSPTAYGVQIIGDDGRQLHLCVRALQGGNGIARAAQLVIYAIDPHQQVVLDSEVLARVYRFSRAEIRVVGELMQGQSVESIAETLSISSYTVRTHLRNLFAKTGTSRQGELIARLAAAVGTLRAIPQNHPFGGCATPTDRVNSETPENGSSAPDSPRES